MKWSKKEPKKEGWYFWRRADNMTDGFRWSVYFVEVWKTEPKTSFWEYGTLVCKPKGGWWAGPIPTPKEGK